MAIQQIPRTIGGQDYTLFIGTDPATGNSVLYVEQATADEKTAQPVRFYPDELNIKFDKSQGTGGVAYIYTTWEKGLVALSGDPIEGKGAPKPMLTNEQDKMSFIAGFGMPILMSMANGFVRAILGHNALPVFNPDTGAVLSYTEEQEAEPPTNDYNSPTETDDPNTSGA